MAYKPSYLNCSYLTIFGVISLLVNISVYSTSTNSTVESNNENIKPSAGNLKFTFPPGGVPEAFFQEVRKIPEESNRNSSGNYDLCQNGSGGLCVPKGDCPAGLKSLESNVTGFKEGVCPGDYECCFGYPEYERSCRVRGGLCVLASDCGNAPKFRDDAECDSEKDEICCILIFK